MVDKLYLLLSIFVIESLRKIPNLGNRVYLLDTRFTVSSNRNRRVGASFPIQKLFVLFGSLSALGLTQGFQAKVVDQSPMLG